jgi:hypothetical protein
MEAGLSFHGDPLDVAVTPWLPTNLQVSLLHRHVPALYRASLAATARFVQDPAFRRMFSFGGLQEECILRDPGYEPDIPLGRMDCFLKDEGVKFLEFNTDGTAGWHYTWALNALARERLGLQPEPFPLPDRLLGTLVKAHTLWSGGDRRKPRIAIVDWDDVGTRSEQEALASSFGRAGYPTTLEDPRALRFEGGKLLGPSGPVDLVYRRVVSEELFARASEARPFLDAYLAGAACFVGSFRTDPAWSKTLFAVFSDPAFRAGLSPGDLASLQETVPFTAPLTEGVVTYRGVTYDTMKLLRDERPYFVVKPARGYGGRGIRAGALTQAREWESFLKKSLTQEGWILQEFVEPPVHPIPHGEGFGFLHVGIFVLMGALAGIMARLTQTPLLSSEVREIWLPAEMSPVEP